MLLYFVTRPYLFSLDEELCYVFSTQNNCCGFLAPYGVIIQSVIQSYFKRKFVVIELKAGKFDLWDKLSFNPFEMEKYNYLIYHLYR